MSKLVTKNILEQLARGLHSKSKTYTDGKVAELNINELKGEVETNKNDISLIRNEIGVAKGEDPEVQATGLYKKIDDGDIIVLETSKSYTDTKVADLVNSAPDDLNTLKELADKITENKDIYDAYVSTVNGRLDTKVDKVEGSRLITEEEVGRFTAKAETSYVDEKLEEAKRYTDEQIAGLEINSGLDERLTSLETLVGNKTGEEPEQIATGLCKDIEDNKKAIELLNKDENNAGSVAHSIKTKLDDYSNTTETKNIINNNLQTLEFRSDESNITLTIGGSDDIAVKTTSLSLTTTQEIEEILEGLDAPVVYGNKRKK